MGAAVMSLTCGCCYVVAADDDRDHVFHDHEHCQHACCPDWDEEE